MKISDVRVRKLYTAGKMRGIVSVTFDDEFVVHDIKVIQGQNGYFIAMPSRKTSDGEFKDICHPIKASVRNQLEQSVLSAFEEALREEQALTPPPEDDLIVDREE
ncbi:MAG: septation regulator SpoVG [Eubacteriaceae bacterium]